MPSLVLCYAPQDEPFARELGHFLEVNLPIGVSYSEGVVTPGVDLIDTTEGALSAEAALVLLSPDSVPNTWRRETWEPVFFAKPLEFGALLGFVLVRPCRFPDLLRRRYFFDASQDPLAAMREVKRWLVRPQPLIPRASSEPSAGLSELRLLIADQPGEVADIASDLAYKFAREYASDFEAVYLLDCHGRSRAGIVGEIGSAMGLRLPGTLDKNFHDLREHCRTHRVLFVLAGVSPEARKVTAFGGRASVILTDGDVSRETTSPVSLRSGWASIAELKSAERFAEAVELLEVMAQAARDSSDFAALSRIEREQFWMQDYAEGNVSAPPHSATDAVQLVFGFALT